MSNDLKASNENMVAATPSIRNDQEYEKFKAEHCEGRRIGFTVIVDSLTTDGKPYDLRYDADRLESVFRDGDMAPMLSFVSSGRRIIVEGAKVKAIEFHKPAPWYYEGQKLWQESGTALDATARSNIS